MATVVQTHVLEIHRIGNSIGMRVRNVEFKVTG